LLHEAVLHPCACAMGKRHYAPGLIRHLKYRTDGIVRVDLNLEFLFQSK
jgi:hypothetical protein